MINKMLEMLKTKKNTKPMDENYKKAKMNALESLRSEMMDVMKGDLEGTEMSQVTVAAPSKDKLAEGLETAKAMLMGDEKQSDDEESDDDASHEEHHSDMMASPDSSQVNEVMNEKENGLTSEEMDTLKHLLKKMKAK